MEPHPDLADLDIPRRLKVGDFQLTPLSPEHTKEDFEAVTASASDLNGFFGSWPAGLTLESNRIDLAWHEREFTARRSFSWILRDDKDAYIGCFYIFPDIGATGKATAALWIKTMENRGAIARAIVPELQTWCASVLPESITLNWKCSPEVSLA